MWTGDTKGMLLVPGALLVTSTPRSPAAFHTGARSGAARLLYASPRSKAASDEAPGALFAPAHDKFKTIDAAVERLCSGSIAQPGGFRQPPISAAAVSRRPVSITATATSLRWPGNLLANLGWVKAPRARGEPFSPLAEAKRDRRLRGHQPCGAGTASKVYAVAPRTA